MSNTWFRLYHEFSTDPKIQMMSEANQRRFIMLLCLKCSNGDVTLHDEEVAFQLRISNEEWLETKALFVAKGFIDEHIKVLNWDKRQFISDSSAARVAKHRALKKKKCNVTVTPPDTDTDTDTDTEVNKTTNVVLSGVKTKKTETDILLEEFGITGDLAKDFKTHRKKVGKGGKEAPITKTGMEGYRREADKAGLSTADAVRESIENGWRGFKAEWHFNLTKSAPAASSAIQADRKPQSKTEALNERNRQNIGNWLNKKMGEENAAS